MLLRMRTSILLPDALYRETKTAAASAGRTVTSLIEEALRERLAKRLTGAKRARKGRLPIFDGKTGLRAGIDLDDSAALLEVLDGRG
jgi:hypothetical protein